jgi:hypothetical protein
MLDRRISRPLSAAGRWCLLLGATMLIAACDHARAPSPAAVDTADIPIFDTITVRHVEDTARVRGRAARPAPTPRLSARADSLSDYLTFLGTFQNAFVAAGRGKRLLVDIGRVDAKIGTPELERAYQEAVKVLSPVRIGDRFRLHGPWGRTDAAVTGYAQWNGRIVATLDVPRAVDSLAQHKTPLVALATYTDSVAAPAPDTCVRDGVSAALATRIAAVRDSLQRSLLSDSAAIAKLPASRKPQISQTVGCFGIGRVLIFANIASSTYDYWRESAVVVDTAGHAIPLRVRDVRFKSHEALHAFDADGDGIDDIAALGRAARSGGTVVLRLDPERRRLEYVMSGFGWENF